MVQRLRGMLTFAVVTRPQLLPELGAIDRMLATTDPGGKRVAPVGSPAHAAFANERPRHGGTRVAWQPRVPPPKARPILRIGPPAASGSSADRSRTPHSGVEASDADAEAPWRKVRRAGRRFQTRQENARRRAAEAAEAADADGPADTGEPEEEPEGSTDKD